LRAKRAQFFKKDRLHRATEVTTACSKEVLNEKFEEKEKGV
jgi:hypothetical protein